MTLRVAIVEDSADLLDELLAFLRHRGFDAWGAVSYTHLTLPTN